MLYIFLWISVKLARCASVYTGSAADGTLTGSSGSIISLVSTCRYYNRSGKRNGATRRGSEDGRLLEALITAIFHLGSLNFTTDRKKKEDGETGPSSGTRTSSISSPNSWASLQLSWKPCSHTGPSSSRRSCVLSSPIPKVPPTNATISSRTSIRSSSRG